MKNPLKILSISAIMIFFLGGAPSASEAERGLKEGEKLPPRELRMMDATTVQVPAPEGITVLLFWSTWSPRSRPALDLWKQYAQDYREHGVSVYTVNADHQGMDAQSLEKVSAFVQESGVTLPVHTDVNLDLFNEIGVIVLPTALFLRGDGTIVSKYPSFPTSAPMDIKESLDRMLGLAREPEEKEKVVEEAYKPKNNALLYFNLGKQLHSKGMTAKAEERYLEALKKDPEYADPLRGLEGIYFADGRTPEAEKTLGDLLASNGLEALREKIGQGEALIFKSGKSDMMEKLKQMMEKKEGDGGNP